MTELQVGRFEPADQDAARALILDGMVERWGAVDPTRNRGLDDIATSCADARFLVARVDNSDLTSVADRSPSTR